MLEAVSLGPQIVCLFAGLNDWLSDRLINWLIDWMLWLVVFGGSAAFCGYSICLDHGSFFVV